MQVPSLSSSGCEIAQFLARRTVFGCIHSHTTFDGGLNARRVARHNRPNITANCHYAKLWCPNEDVGPSKSIWIRPFVME